MDLSWLGWLGSAVQAGASERLTALDTSFLAAERPEAPLHIGAISVLEGGPLLDEAGRLRLDRVRQRVAERLDRVPRLRQRVQPVPLDAGYPVWVDDEDFDLAHHVRAGSVDPPGDRTALLDAAERLLAEPLDRSRPLWELWVLTGLADGNVALVEKVHHAMVDGVSGVELAAALLDLEPDVPPGEAAPWTPRPAPGWARLVADGVGAALATPLAATRDLLPLALRPADLVGRALGVADAAATTLLASGPRRRTSLHQPVGPSRELRTVQAPLEDLRAASHALGVTINDLVLASVAGGIRALLLARGEEVDDLALQVLVPVSVRTDDERLDLGNRVAALVVPLPVGEGSPLARACEIGLETRTRRHHHQDVHSEWLLDTAERLPAAAISLLARSLEHQRVVEVVVTNVPGPPTPLWFAGARVLESVPVVPLGAGLTVNVAVLSYDGTVTVAVHADAEACPDVDLLVDGLSADLEELLVAPWAAGLPDEPATARRHRARRARTTLRLRAGVAAARTTARADG